MSDQSNPLVEIHFLLKSVVAHFLNFYLEICLHVFQLLTWIYFYYLQFLTQLLNLVFVVLLVLNNLSAQFFVKFLYFSVVFDFLLFQSFLPLFSLHLRTFLQLSNAVLSFPAILFPFFGVPLNNSFNFLLKLLNLLSVVLLFSMNSVSLTLLIEWQFSKSLSTVQLWSQKILLKFHLLLLSTLSISWELVLNILFHLADLVQIFFNNGHLLLLLISQIFNLSLILDLHLFHLFVIHILYIFTFLALIFLILLITVLQFPILSPHLIDFHLQKLHFLVWYCHIFLKNTFGSFAFLSNMFILHLPIFYLLLSSSQLLGHLQHLALLFIIFFSLFFIGTYQLFLVVKNILLMPVFESAQIFLLLVVDKF